MGDLLPMDVDPSDFLAPNPRSRSSESRFLTLLRKGWWIFLPVVALIPLGISMLEFRAPKGKSYTQAIEEEKNAAATQDESDLASSDPSGLASASGDEPIPEPTLEGLSSPTPLAQKDSQEKATPDPQPSSKISGNPVNYRVRQGDTLSGIAQRSGVRSTDIAAANGMRGQDHIFAGQLLVIPNVPKEKVAALSGPASKPKTPETIATTGAKPKASEPKASPSTLATSGKQSPSAAPVRTVVLGPPAPAPLPVAGLPAPVANPPGNSTIPNHPIILGPPASPVGTPNSNLAAAPGPSGNLPVRGSSSFASKRYPDKADYVPLINQPPQETIHAAALEIAPDPGQTKTSAGIRPLELGLPPELSKSGVISYLVQPFDSLTSIAKAHGTTPEIIIQLNGEGALLEGQTILLPISQNKLAIPALR